MALGMYSDDFYAANRPYQSIYLSDTDYPAGTEPLSLTIRTDVTREEHELLSAIREYNRAADVQTDADTVLEKARNEMNEANAATEEARWELDEAMRAVKHGYAY